MKITKNELKEMINESVERQLRKTNHRKINQRNNYKRKVNESLNIDYKYFPKSKRELQKIIKREIKMNGNTCDLNMIDTSNITDMSNLFFYNSKFNGNVSNWDVSNVKNMSYMFYKSNFNGDISKWDVSNVKTMEYMFANSKFNGDISKWNVSEVNDMSHMFESSIFNGDISKWNVIVVLDMSYMFANSKFTGNIDKWNVINVANMESMFNKAKFKGNIFSWLNKVDNHCILKNFGIFDGVKINSYSNFKNYTLLINLDRVYDKSQKAQKKKIAKNSFKNWIERDD